MGPRTGPKLKEPRAIFSIIKYRFVRFAAPVLKTTQIRFVVAEVTLLDWYFVRISDETPTSLSDDCCGFRSRKCKDTV